jgi:hypothetical protein
MTERLNDSPNPEPATVFGLAATDGKGKNDGREYFAAAVTPATIDTQQRTVDVIWFTGIDVPRMSWDGPYTRRFDPAGCDLSVLNSGAPVLDNHNTYDGAEGQKGVVMRAWVDGGLYKATLRFSRRQECNGLWQDIEDKIVQKFSMGVEILAEHEIKQENQPVVRMADKWRPFEISVAPLPADFGTTTLSGEQVAAVQAAGSETSVVTQRAFAQAKETPVMDELNQQAAGEQARLNEQALAAARDEAVKSERLRQSSIRTMAAPFKLEERFVSGLVDDGLSVEVARERIMKKLAESANAHAIVPANPEVTMGTDATDKRRECMEASLVLRGNPTLPREIQDKGRAYAGMTLLELARECLTAAGVNIRGMSRLDIATAALLGRTTSGEFLGGMATTSDFPNILANVANKTLRQAYEAAPRTFTPFCRQVSASDFKPVNRVQLSDIAALQKLNEKGEFLRTYLSDSKETYSLATWGGIVPITRKVVINDDLQALTRIPFGLGVAAGQSESDAVWAVITDNAAMSDTYALFHSNHNNLNTTSALALDKLGAGRKKMRLQTAPKGTKLSLVPRYLICPVTLEATALPLINPMGLAATALTSVVPEWIRNLVLITEPRLDDNSTTSWYLAADPGGAGGGSPIDTIEYCYLEGQQGVFIEYRQGFDVDGVEIKARLDFAAAAIDHRGLQKNTA